MSTINRLYKDRLFRLLFADEKNKANALALYNALNNSNYTNADDLEFNTLDNVIHLGMKNDLSFIVADSMSLYEQQASHNPNMPLRGFLYFAKLFNKYLANQGKSLHSESLLTIPTPRFVVFYNGIAKRPATEKLRLSNAFLIPDSSGEFEWTATVINLNHDDNTGLLQSCKPLSDYTTLVSKIQAYQKTMPITEAVNKAIDDCITEGILAEFLQAHRAEVIDMYLSEVNEDILRERLMEEGEQKGRDEFMRSIILKKITKGKSLEQIADELEENVEDIRPLYEELISTANN